MNQTDVRELFHQRGLRCTRQRELLYGVLESSRQHPTAEELHHAALRQDPHLSLATVYNTLEAFERVGLCRQLPGAGHAGAARFDAATHEHVHLTTPDGRVFDVPDDLSDRILDQLPEDLLRELERRMGMRVGRVNVQLVAQPGPENH